KGKHKRVPRPRAISGPYTGMPMQSLLEAIGPPPELSQGPHPLPPNLYIEPPTVTSWVPPPGWDPATHRLFCRHDDFLVRPGDNVSLSVISNEELAGRNRSEFGSVSHEGQMEDEFFDNYLRYRCSPVPSECFR